MARRHPPSTPATSKDPPRESSGSKGARGGRWQAPGSAPAATSSFAWQQWLFAAALLIAVLLAYQPAWQGGFIWDDDTHLVNNPVLKPGGLARIWVPGSYANYWPLTATAYWLQFRIWGLNPLGFHLVNIALHALSALLVWRVLVQLRVPGAMFAAAIFALHPVNVESVAWITQLKGILSLLLSLLSVWFYLLYEQQGKQWRFALSLAAFLLSTLAKGIALTLPVVLLACSLVAARPNRIPEPVASRPLPSNWDGYERHRGLDATRRGRFSRHGGAVRRLAQPGRHCGLRRVVLLLEADLAA